MPVWRKQQHPSNSKTVSLHTKQTCLCEPSIALLHFTPHQIYFYEPCWVIKILIRGWICILALICNDVTVFHMLMNANSSTQLVHVTCTQGERWDGFMYSGVNVRHFRGSDNSGIWGFRAQICPPMFSMYTLHPTSALHVLNKNAKCIRHYQEIRRFQKVSWLCVLLCVFVGWGWTILETSVI